MTTDFLNPDHVAFNAEPISIAYLAFQVHLDLAKYQTAIRADFLTSSSAS
jgi:hypothetical protein